MPLTLSKPQFDLLLAAEKANWNATELGISVFQVESNEIASNEYYFILSFKAGAIGDDVFIMNTTVPDSVNPLSTLTEHVNMVAGPQIDLIRESMRLVYFTKPQLDAMFVSSGNTDLTFEDTVFVLNGRAFLNLKCVNPAGTNSVEGRPCPPAWG